MRYLLFILGNSGSNRHHSSKTTIGLHTTAFMCAQTLKESDRKCEHSFAELPGAPSAHPSGGKNEFKIKKIEKHWGQSKFSLLGDGLQRIKPVLTLAAAAGRAGCLRQPSRKFDHICQNLSSRRDETQNFAFRRDETPYFGPGQNYHEKGGRGTFWVKC